MKSIVILTLLNDNSLDIANVISKNELNGNKIVMILLEIILIKTFLQIILINGPVNYIKNFTYAVHMYF